MEPQTDELVKFAAEKLGVELCLMDGEKPHYKAREMHPQWFIFRLTSWDLLGKGLAVFLTDQTHDFFIEWHNGQYNRHIKLYEGIFRGIAQGESSDDIPVKFWTAWYELETSKTMQKCNVDCNAFFDDEKHQ